MLEVTFFAKFILLLYNSGIVARMIYFRDNSNEFTESFVV